jgi:hypothetical protein
LNGQREFREEKKEEEKKKEEVAYNMPSRK